MSGVHPRITNAESHGQKFLAFLGKPEFMQNFGEKGTESQENAANFGVREELRSTAQCVDGALQASPESDCQEKASHSQRN